jgi:hypothetical protein
LVRRAVPPVSRRDDALRLPYRELTFQRGEIFTARFAPDGYAAASEGRPAEIFVSRLERPEARPFGLPGAGLFAISSSGEMAVGLHRRFLGPSRGAVRWPGSA